MRKRIALVLALALLSACSVPRGAALRQEVLQEAGAETPSFEVVPVTRANLSALASWPVLDKTGHYLWPKAQSGASSNTIRSGDSIDLVIWDSQENSLLTNPGEKFTRITDEIVAPDGTIFLPYVGKLKVSGLTPDRARELVQDRLEAIVPSAQVQLSFEQGRENAVEAVSGFSAPGTYPLPSRNYRILGLISDAGGIPNGLRNPQVRLLRGHDTYQISADRLFESAARNALLRPGDAVVVEEDDRSFVALGASGSEDLVYFTKDRLSALEALALMNGLDDSSADPGGVLILRDYSASHLGKPGYGPTRGQVVFTVDLTSADGLFAAGRFHVQPGDTVLATAAPVTDVQKVFALLGSAFGLGRTVATLR